MTQRRETYGRRLAPHRGGSCVCLKRALRCYHSLFFDMPSTLAHYWRSPITIVVRGSFTRKHGAHVVGREKTCRMSPIMSSTRRSRLQDAQPPKHA